MLLLDWAMFGVAGRAHRPLGPHSFNYRNPETSTTATQRPAPLSPAASAGSPRGCLIRDGRTVFARQALLALCEADYGWSILARNP